MQEAIQIDEKKKFQKQSYNEEQIFSIQEFCTLKKLSKYHYDSLSAIYNKVKKTISNWEKELVNSKLIDKKEFN